MTENSERTSQESDNYVMSFAAQTPDNAPISRVVETMSGMAINNANARTFIVDFDLGLFGAEDPVPQIWASAGRIGHSYLLRLPEQRRIHIEARAAELATLKDLRLAAEQTQAELAATLGVRQDTISRLEQRSDMLLSTLRRYVEAMGGTLDLVVKFPDRPSVVLDHLPHGARVFLGVPARRAGRRRTG